MIQYYHGLLICFSLNNKGQWHNRVGLYLRKQPSCLSEFGNDIRSSRGTARVYNKIYTINKKTILEILIYLMIYVKMLDIELYTTAR